MKHRLHSLWALCLAAGALGAHAGGLERLENFVKATHTGHAEFTQVVTSPGKDGQAARTKTSSGTFAFSRPGRFKFVYRKPFEQTIVADGQTLWLYDVDLNQVSARSQAAVLGSTPAALIASAPDLHALQADFSLQSAPDLDGLEWVQATPKASESSLQSVRIGFKEGTLAVLEILDSFGQRSRISFSALVLNSGVEASAFAFKPPPGADLLRQ